jgi:predicted molibdopterin-dependent oxidoreductase YjgC
MNQILRISPNPNPKANGYFISDEVRLEYKKYEENRLINPKINEIPTDWNEFYLKAAGELKKFKPQEVFALCSPMASVESNYALLKFADEIIGTKNIGFFTHFDESTKEGILSVKDKSPNLAGLQKLGLSLDVHSKAAELLSERIKKGEIKAVIILEEDLSQQSELVESIKNIELVIDISLYDINSSFRNLFQAPASTAFESEGTFINKDILIQHFTPIIETKSQKANVKFGRWDKFGADNDSWAKKNIYDVLPAWEIISKLAEIFSGTWNFNTAENVFDELKEKYNFGSLSYKMLDEYKGYNLNSETNEKPGYIYKSHIYKP